MPLEEWHNDLLNSPVDWDEKTVKICYWYDIKNVILCMFRVWRASLLQQQKCGHISVTKIHNYSTKMGLHPKLNIIAVVTQHQGLQHLYLYHPLLSMRINRKPKQWWQRKQQIHHYKNVFHFFKVFEIISSALKCQMQVNLPGIKFLGTEAKLQKREKFCCEVFKPSIINNALWGNSTL